MLVGGLGPGKGRKWRNEGREVQAGESCKFGTGDVGYGT